MPKNQNLERISLMCDALSNIHRLTIFNRLVNCQTPDAHWKADDLVPFCVGEISKDLGIVPSTASHHIKELANSELITLKRDGQRIICTINPDATRELIDYFASVLGG